MPFSKRAGSYLVCSAASEQYKAFHPRPLPPDPPLHFDQSLTELLANASRALGRLDGIATFLPHTHLLLYSYIRKEAVLSSQIEGTQSSLSDLLLYENADAPGVLRESDDVQEVSNYVAAMTHGLARLREGFPLSLRLIREMHEVLLSHGRGSPKAPGEFRRSQNWIGGSRPGTARYVPPPPEHLMDCLGALEKFLHDDPVPTSTLIKAALAHVQFESIHPFLDGNGRLGRLLITLLFCAEGILAEPILYLSLYFKMHRQTYYELLTRVREEGAWEDWLRFFLTGVWETAEQAARTGQTLYQLFAEDRRRIETLGRPAVSTLRLHNLLQHQVIVSISQASEKLKVAVPTVTTALTHLQRLGIVREMTGRQRNRQFVYDEYLKILSEGTEPL
ncbi:MAG: Fic family protein [Armatimonadota bacterium]|nr:Fic family protein [Armatimonadota bacterium]